MKRKHNVLVLGAAGFIGRNLVEELCRDRSYSVTAFDLVPGPLRELDGRGPTFVQGNFLVESDLERAFRGKPYDTVVHLVSTTLPAGSPQPEMIYDIESNLVSTLRLLGLMRKYGARNIVFASSGGTVYGVPEPACRRRPIPETHPTNPICSHGIIKLAIEKYLHLHHYLYGLNYLVLRISNPYGEGHSSAVQGLINVALWRALRGETLTVWGDGKVVRDFIYIGDCVKAIKALIDKGVVNTVLNVGSGTGMSVNGALSLVRRVAGGLKVKRDHFRKFDVKRAVLDVSRLKALVPFKPISLLQGVKNTRSWLLKSARASAKRS